MEAGKIDMQKFSYHTHTCFSDGKNTAEEMIQQAIDLGWEELGISEHLIVHKNIADSFSWYSWKKEPKIFHFDFNSIYDSFAKHIEDVQEIAGKYNIKVRVGAEVDFFTYSGWFDEFMKFKERINLDYYISGNHFLFIDDECSNIIDIKDAAHLDIKEQENCIRRHFKTLGEAAKSGVFSFIAHIDYIRKTQICGRFDFLEEKKELIKVFTETNTATEVSTKGLRKANDFYPNSDMIKQLMDNNIKLVISDDAHRVGELGYNFSDAEKVFSDNNYSNRWFFTKNNK